MLKKSIERDQELIDIKKNELSTLHYNSIEKFPLSFKTPKQTNSFKKDLHYTNSTFA